MSYVVESSTYVDFMNWLQVILAYSFSKVFFFYFILFLFIYYWQFFYFIHLFFYLFI